jgi:hypothetical protein
MGGAKTYVDGQWALVESIAARIAGKVDAAGDETAFNWEKGTGYGSGPRTPWEEMNWMFPLPIINFLRSDPWFAGPDVSSILYDLRFKVDDARLISGSGYDAEYDGMIYFRSGQYQPHSPSGIGLIAHEAYHAVQEHYAGGPAAYRSYIQAELDILNPLGLYSRKAWAWSQTSYESQAAHVGEHFFQLVDRMMTRGNLGKW